MWMGLSRRRGASTQATGRGNGRAMPSCPPGYPRLVDADHDRRRTRQRRRQGGRARSARWKARHRTHATLPSSFPACSTSRRPPPAIPAAVPLPAFRRADLSRTVLLPRPRALAARCPAALRSLPTSCSPGCPVPYRETTDERPATSPRRLPSYSSLRLGLFLTRSTSLRVICLGRAKRSPQSVRRCFPAGAFQDTVLMVAGLSCPRLCFTSA